MMIFYLLLKVRFWFVKAGSKNQMYIGLVETRNMFDHHAVGCAPKLAHFSHPKMYVRGLSSVYLLLDF
jgi:hypothetical protein